MARIEADAVFALVNVHASIPKVRGYSFHALPHVGAAGRLLTISPFYVAASGTPRQRPAAELAKDLVAVADIYGATAHVELLDGRVVKASPGESASLVESRFAVQQSGAGVAQ